MPKPLKRHPSLVPLSKDHHLGLLLCWKIRTGIKKNIELSRIREYVEYFFDEHLKHHFLQEEEVLLSRMDEDNDLRRETERQHKELYALRESISQKSEGKLEEDILEFAAKLDAHIRFEERQLFPYLQDNFEEKELAEIATLLEKEDACDTWKDEFWR